MLEAVATVKLDKLNPDVYVPVAVDVGPVVPLVTVKLTPALTAKIVFAPLYPDVVAPEIVMLCPAESPVVFAVEYVTTVPEPAIAVIATEPERPVTVT